MSSSSPGFGRGAGGPKKGGFARGGRGGAIQPQTQTQTSPDAASFQSQPVKRQLMGPPDGILADPVTFEVQQSKNSFIFIFIFITKIIPGTGSSKFWSC